jgi:outer membrane protein OmpA-like peptidoglycan-associated protein
MRKPRAIPFTAAKRPASIAGTTLLLAALLLPADAGAQQHLRQRGSGVTVDWTVVDQLQGRPPARQQPAAGQQRRPANRAAAAPRQAAQAPASPSPAPAAPALRQPPPPPDTTPVAGASPPPRPPAAAAQPRPAAPAAPAQEFRAPAPPPSFAEQAPAVAPPVPVSPTPPPQSVASSMPVRTAAPAAAPAAVAGAAAAAAAAAAPALAPPAPAPAAGPPAAAAPAAAAAAASAPPPAAPPLAASLPPSRAGQPSARLAFAADSADPPADLRNEMRDLVEQLRRAPDGRLRIEGFAAGEDANRSRRLSLSRALAIRAYLIDQGLASTRMDVFARGNQPEDGPADRVDVTLVRR